MKELVAFLEANKDNEEVKAFIGDLVKKYAPPITLDTVKPLFETDPAFKQFLSTVGDSRVTAALKTYEEKTLPVKLAEKEAELRKVLVPKETDEQKMLRELKERLDKAERESRMKDLKMMVASELSAKKLPSEFVDFIVDDDEEKTKARLGSFLTRFEEIKKTHVDAEVAERFKKHGGVPPKEPPVDDKRKKDDEKSDTDFLRDALRDKEKRKQT